MNFSNVTIDLGNGQVLLSEQVSKEDMIKDEVERHHRMTSKSMSPRQCISAWHDKEHQALLAFTLLLGIVFEGTNSLDQSYE